MSELTNERIWQGFTRQRRNLILVSIVLLLILTEELTFVKLSFLGNVTELKHQGTILFLLWTGWLYWLLRYYQYYRDLGDKGFEIAFFKKFHSVLKEVAFNKARRSKKWETLLETSGFNHTYQTDLNDYKIETNKPFHIEVKLHIRIHLPKDNMWPVHPIEVKLKGIELLIPNIKGWIHVFFSTTLATEYLLPFILSMTPIFYVIYSQLIIFLGKK